MLPTGRSVGSSTPEWAYRTFTGDHDIAYFSGNPFINDLGIPLNELKWGASCDYEWTASDHISDVRGETWVAASRRGAGTFVPTAARNKWLAGQERAHETMSSYAGASSNAAAPATKS